MTQTNGSQKSSEHYRELLLAKRSDLYSSRRTKLGLLIGPGSAAPEDLAPVFHDQFIALHINGLDYRQLKMVEEALERTVSGDYGICADCGAAIPARRLEAIPWANRCVACEECFGSASDSPQLAQFAA